MTVIHNFSVGRQSSTRTVGRNYQSVVVMLIISIFLLGGIASRLAYLQLVEGERNKELAENNRIRLIPKPPVRGNIFDRKGRILASTRLSRSVFVWPKTLEKEKWPETFKRLSEILNIPEGDIEKRLQNAGNSPVSRIRIARNISPGQITALAEYSNQLEGVEVDVETVREYPNGDLGAHVLGYTGEINEEELADRRDEGYRPGDVIGQMGVEESFQEMLRGEWGGQQVEVDGADQVVKVLGKKNAKPGKDVKLTLDIDVQKAAEAALGYQKGAIVAIDPNNGAVLAMVSRPTFDPNIFSTRITQETWTKLQGRGNPFVNRAIRGFPPASTFKIVTAAAGMETGKYPPDVVLPTFAYLRVGGTAFGEWNKAGFGPLGYVRALAMSSNTFHGQIGKGIGGEKLIEWSRKFGFGQKTGIELNEESSGLIADDTWKQKRFNWEWTVGDTVNMSIGQGFTQATPLQVAMMFAVPANGGYKITPHLLLDDRSPDQWRKSMNLQPATLEKLRQGLRAVVTSGTGKNLNVPHLPPVAGKSGTAEAPPGKPHAWFGGYAPADKPEIVVVAFAEHSGGGGGSTAGPMVRQVLEGYFKAKSAASQK
ncbi:MAG: penicillin-binding protein 2 [Symploca sp. SIO2E6]|nr:penicillin-binding protein 2 [Symploca sp. SIO2E6]